MSKTKVSIELPDKTLDKLDSLIENQAEKTGLNISRNNMINKIIKDFLMTEDAKQ